MCHPARFPRLLLALLILAPGAALADGEETDDVPTMTVTATRTPRSVTTLTGTAEIVEREELDLKDSWTVEEALAEYPGVDVMGEARYGQEVRLNTRGIPSGFGTQRTLVMLDGRALTDEYLGNVDLAQYPLGGMRRVELVRGPASALYGTNALGGVVNLIPRRGTATSRTEIVGEYGSFGTGRLAINHGRMVGDLDFFIAAEGTRTDGYMRNSSGDDMDWETSSAFTNLGYADERWDVRGYLSYFRGSATSKAFDRDVERNLQDVVATYRVDPERDADTRLRIYRTGYEQNLAWFERPESEYDQTSLGAILTQSYRVHPAHLLVGGVEWRFEAAEVEELADTVDEDDTTWSAFAEDEWEVLDNLSVVLGGRYDKRVGVAGEFGWRVGANWRVVEGTTLRGAAGRAYRFPTISDRFLPDTAFFGVTFSGNPDLDPEILYSAEVGIDQQIHERVTASATAFASQFEDFWDFIMDTDGVFRPMNIGEVRIYGAEVSVRGDLGAGFSAVASYTYNNAEYTKFEGDEDVEGNRVDDTVVHSGALSVVWRHPQGHMARFGWLVLGNRYTDPENTEVGKLDGFNVADLQFVYAFTPEVSATLSVKNVFNSHYQVRPEFFQPGRAVFVGVRLTFGP